MNSTDIDNQLLRMRGFNVDIETFKKVLLNIIVNLKIQFRWIFLSKIILLLK